MPVFNIRGSFRAGSQIKDFNKLVEAESKDHAQSIMIKRLGSNHGLPRRFINILEVVLNEENGRDEGEPETSD